MFSDPQFWVAVAFVAFIAAVFNPVRKMLTTNLDAQIKDIKDKIEEAESKVKQIEQLAEDKLKDQISKRQVLAEAKIDQLTRDANNLIQSHITSTAIEATITILQQKLNTEEQQKLINTSIQELGSALKN